MTCSRCGLEFVDGESKIIEDCTLDSVSLTSKGFGLNGKLNSARHDICPPPELFRALSSLLGALEHCTVSQCNATAMRTNVFLSMATARDALHLEEVRRALEAGQDPEVGLKGFVN